MSRAVWFIMCSFVGAAGCSAESKTISQGVETASGDDTADDGSSDTGSLEDGEAAVWWELGAELVISGGLVDPNLSALSVRMLNANVEPLCDETLALLGVSEEPGTPSAEIFSWWQFTPAAPSEDCSDHDDAPPSELLLGVGELEADVRAMLGPAGLAGVADGLNGAYVSLDGGDTVYTFGVAGTDEAYAGAAGAATSAPLADGTWKVISLFAFDYGD